jgi:vitamin B12 transporter
MYPALALLAAAAADQTIVVTAAREPASEADSAASVTIIGDAEIERLGLPLAGDLLRLVPGVAVATTGPPGTQTQVRIRGAEANHSLLFVDGIRFNDPAAGNEPRFELLASDPMSRIEVVRGPQSALWGSEAIGGVVAVETADPLDGERASGIAEYGSLDSSRISGGLALRSGELGISGSAGQLRSAGIDSFGSSGERDGFRNRTASLKAAFAPNTTSKVGVTGHWIDARNDYDGLDPVTFVRADTFDTTRNRLWAVRGWGGTRWGGENGWTLSADASLLDSSNRNALGGDRLNASFGRRSSFGAQVAKGQSAGSTSHRLIAAIEHQREAFRARDEQFSGATNQDRERKAMAWIGEWRAHWGEAIATDLTIRHDSFSEFRDATTIRASVLARLGRGWSAHAGYGEGVAQPTFYDLFGFFPGSFVGNPALGPERATSWEAGLRWSDGELALGATAFTSRLTDEIVDLFDPSTFLSSAANAEGTSRRRGVEVEGAWQPSQALSFTFAYTWLDAEEQRIADGLRLREVRRPRHSGAVTAGYTLGRLRTGASLGYAGSRGDTDFDRFPAAPVRLGSYMLASLQLAWAFGSGFEGFARAENGFDADYQDVFGYDTPGRRIYAGIRLRVGD